MSVATLRTVLRTSVIVGLLALSSLLPAAAARAAEPGSTTVHQIRIYDLVEGKEDAFHARFRDHTVRIMNRHGFKILSMWEAKADGKPKFVYLLEWPSRQVMAASWAGFMADKEWSDIKAASREVQGPIMGGIQDLTLVTTPYSPTL